MKSELESWIFNLVLH